jgi:hypothetical protein
LEQRPESLGFFWMFLLPCELLTMWVWFFSEALLSVAGGAGNG